MAVDDPIFTARLVHTCTIERKGTGSTDESGASTGAWTDLDTEVPCFLDGPFRDTETQVQADAKGVFEELLLFLPGDTDIVEKDAVSNIVRTSDDTVLQSERVFVRKLDNAEDADAGDVHHLEAHLDRMAP